MPTQDTSLRVVDTTDRVRTLTLSRRDKRNALDTTLARALVDALRSADADPAVGAVLVEGDGPVFCAGADLAEFRGERANPDAEALRSDVFLDLQLIFETIRVPVVAAMGGPAVGAEAARAIAATLAGRPRAAMRETKGLFIESASLPIPDALREARAASRARSAQARGPR